MRVLVVRPGPAFSVADVANGWVSGLKQAGCRVVDFNYDDRLNFYEKALREVDADPKGFIRLASKGIEAACYEMWPEVVLIVSGFFLDPFTLALIRERGHRLVLLATESPYQDDGQIKLAAHFDTVILNDPTNIDRFRAEACKDTHYIPHAHDPDVHKPSDPDPDLVSDFAFVGTGYPNRVEFFEQVDWTGIGVSLGGYWQNLKEDSPLRPFVAHDEEFCLDNRDTVRMYQSTRSSANLYRQEGQDGWAMGPREVELAATGTFFLRDPRPEGDEVLPMLPTFTEPGEFTEKLRWWLGNDHGRELAAKEAAAAVADRTFVNNAKRLLRLLSRRN